MSVIPTVKRLEFRLRDHAGTPMNATVVLRIRIPSGTVVTVSTSNPSVGEYVATYQPTEPGTHLCAWEATGAAIGRWECSFDVAPKSFP